MGDRFEPTLVIGIKSRKLGTIDVEYPNQHVLLDQWDHDFRLRSRIASNVAGEGMHVLDALCLPRACRRTAHALVQRDAYASRQPLERADDELGAVEEVEPHPVEVRQRVIDQRREVGGIGDAVGFTVQQGTDLAGQRGILFGLGAGQGR